MFDLVYKLMIVVYIVLSTYYSCIQDRRIAYLEGKVMALECMAEYYEVRIKNGKK